MDPRFHAQQQDAEQMRQSRKEGADPQTFTGQTGRLLPTLPKRMNCHRCGIDVLLPARKPTFIDGRFVCQKCAARVLEFCQQCGKFREHDHLCDHMPPAAWQQQDDVAPAESE